jgi:hypothetical protein
MKPSNKLVGNKPKDGDKPTRVPQKDKVSEMLRSNYNFSGPIIFEWTDVCLSTTEYGRPKQHYCDRYYPELKIAIDKFYSSQEYTERAADFKRKALNSKGIRYIALTPDVSFEEALATAETQKV